MNKIVKGCIIGALSFGAFEFAGQFGKGYMLGYLAKTNLSADEVIEILSAYKHPTAWLISDVAKFTKKRQKES